MKKSGPLLFLLLCISHALADNDFGRLFYTAAERQAFDRERARHSTAWTSFDGEIRHDNRPRYRWLSGQGQFAAPSAPPGAVGDRFGDNGSARQPLLGDGQITRHQPAR